MQLAWLLAPAFCLQVLASETARAQASPFRVTQRVSVDSAANQGNDDSLNAPSISADGRYVAFRSKATNLVSGDTNAHYDVFVFNRATDEQVRVSLSSAGVQGNAQSGLPSVSSDGRFVAFASAATNFVTDNNNTNDIFVRDRDSDVNGIFDESNGVQTTRVSVTSAGAEAHGLSSFPVISADGRYVGFESAASDLVASDINGVSDVFVHDRQTGTTVRASLDTGGLDPNGASLAPSISPDGRYVAFYSVASDLVTGDTNGTSDVFRHDRQTGVTVRVSVDTAGGDSNGASGSASVSGDGLYVAFESLATDLVSGDTNGFGDVFIRDVQAGVTTRASVDSTATQGDGASSSPRISTSGEYVSFHSGATNLIAVDTNDRGDVFLHYRPDTVTDIVSIATDGTQANGNCMDSAISADGRYVGFYSDASTLVANDTGGLFDMFVHDVAAAGVTTFCHPGVAGVVSCPCSNPPSTLSRGCNNSAGTGGATLTAGGVAYVNADTLVFYTTAELASATSVVIQGDASIAAGTVFGQGVRCVGGNLLRLYTKTASSGSITAPDFSVSDPTVSARSAALGGTLSGGMTRYYFVEYRDSTVLGGCPSSSTFNASGCVLVTWWP